MNKRKLLLTFATTLIIVGNAYANSNIRGTVFSKNSAEPLDFVSVQLVNPETGVPLQIGTLTDEKGVFVIEKAPAGKYVIRFSNIGSITQEREILISDKDLNIGRIDLSDDNKLLQEIVVVGQKSQMSINSEHRIFNVNSNISSAGASADELLAAVPSVDVNSDGEIYLRVNSDVMVWINGKEM